MNMSNIISYLTDFDRRLANVRWWQKIFYSYGVATMSRMLKNIGLFCKRALQKRPVFCKETCIFKHPTNRSHPITKFPFASPLRCGTKISVPKFGSSTTPIKWGGMVATVRHNMTWHDVTWSVEATWDMSRGCACICGNMRCDWMMQRRTRYDISGWCHVRYDDTIRYDMTWYGHVRHDLCLCLHLWLLLWMWLCVCAHGQKVSPVYDKTWYGHVRHELCLCLHLHAMTYQNDVT